MAVAPGTRLGPYEITAPLGSGGMGEVYRAIDTRLDRKVAIKILPAALAADAQFRLRLEREARTISSLNHPNICTLYDVGHDNGSDYLVMELLEGESLAERVARGPLPSEEVLRYGMQIAEALDKAHRQGIVHRDLKPGNVMLTKSGAKLLDFGLAKSGTPVDISGATMQKQLTAEGMIVGTFQYMAPEQLEGSDADPRSDIFALGALLYEMATGKRAFEGKTKTSLIAAIVTGRPTPVSQIQPLAPPALEHVIDRCLEKDPADRWQSAHDVAEELKWISAKGSQAGIAAPVASRRRARERLSWLLNAALVIAAAALTWGIIELRREAPRVVVSSILPPEKTQFAFDSAGPPALSPDGQRIVFGAQRAGLRMLYVRSLNGTAAQALAGTEGGTFPFWSPDSRSIGFFAGGKLKKIDAAGGPAQTLADAPAGRGGSWSSKRVIVFAPFLSGAIFKVSDSGGAATAVTRTDPAHGLTTHRWPSFLPDGRHFVYMTSSAGGAIERSIMAGSIDGDLRRQVALAASNAIYSSRGYLVYLRERTLVAQPFDPKSLRLGPDAVPIAENVSGTGRWDAFFTMSNDGTLAYQSGTGNAEATQLTWFDATGKQIGTAGKPAGYQDVALSHDGRRVAVTIEDPATRHWDIWIEDLARNAPTRLTFDPANEWSPIWSPDDSTILYTANVKGPGVLMMKRSSGTGAEELLYEKTAFAFACDWSPDGKTILYQEQGGAGSNGWDLWLYSREERKARVFLRTPFAELFGRFSPDGRWISYQSDESGKFQIYVLPSSGNGGKWLISTEGGTRARWRRDGKQIYYLSPDSKLMAVDVEARGDEFTAGVPREMFSLNLRPIFGMQYDLTADGKRFLINTAMEQTEIAPVTLVQNWAAALRK